MISYYVEDNVFVSGLITEAEAVMLVRDGYSIVHACREPFHRSLLGYTGRSAPENNPERLVAIRGNRMYLNLLDAQSAEYIPREIIDDALDFISEAVNRGRNVLVHCNQGKSRSPAIVFLFLRQRQKLGVLQGPVDHAIAAFKQTLYSSFEPGPGILEFLRQRA